ncbi:hybrid sensor histidine kinase/response regulator [Archangium violaceum]|uniref:hybrid sensor histidine kinase/response regulator n=1 Tax=Archangium violaceum TaxID=83451 RepID=UPI00069626BD|nr:ATP-binding protein [Archangium violaceum]
MTAPTRTLLLVDDSPEDRSTWAAFLCEDKDCTYIFLEAEDAEEGLALCHSHRVDCLVLDYELPQMDGVSLLRRLRVELGEEAPPVVMVTGRGSEQVAVAAMKAGAADYLVKSDITPASLYRAAQNAMERASLERGRREAERARDALLARERQARAEVEGLMRERERLLDLANRHTAELEAIFQSMAEALYVGYAGGITRANQPALSQLGYSRLEELNRNIATLASEIRTRRADTGEIIPAEDQAFTHALQGRADVQEVVVRHLLTGQDRIVRSSCAPVRVDGEVVAAVAINTDITEQKMAEAERARLTHEVQAQRALFDAVLQQMPSGVIVVEPSGKLVLANARVEEILRFPFRSARNMSEASAAYQVFHLDGSPSGPDEQPLARSLRSGEVVVGEEAEVVRGDGSRITLSVSSSPVNDERGRRVAAVGIFLDVTQRKRDEAELRRRTEFEQQLIGIVSHDLRNPISAILLGAQLILRQEELGDRLRVAVSRIQGSAERGVRMVRDLLDFTQARLGGGIRIVPSTFDLHALTLQVMDEVRMSHPERDFQVRQEGDARGDWDPDRLAQVLTNLTSNAAKYSPAGTQVSVVTRGEGEWVTLEVHNEGTPIPPELRQRLFEPMQRGGADVDRAGRSIGLGLYIVDSIVRAHGGTIDVRSSAAEGTTFTVRLPRQPP